MDQVFVQGKEQTALQDQEAVHHWFRQTDTPVQV